MAILSVNKADFEKEVLEESLPVVVDFWAEWCGPCKIIAPILNEISSELGGAVKIVKVNIDDNPELAVQYGVRSIPTLLAFREGEVIKNMTGSAPKSSLYEWIKAIV